MLITPRCRFPIETRTKSGDLNFGILIFPVFFRYAKYLEVLSLPDDMRELLDEYLDANNLSESQKDCEEYFQCPFSIKDTFKRNLSGNSLQ